jgi:hypothetical protein
MVEYVLGPVLLVAISVLFLHLEGVRSSRTIDRALKFILDRLPPKVVQVTMWDQLVRPARDRWAELPRWMGMTGRVVTVIIVAFLLVFAALLVVEGVGTLFNGEPFGG